MFYLKSFNNLYTSAVLALSSQQQRLNGAQRRLAQNKIAPLVKNILLGLSSFFALSSLYATRQLGFRGVPLLALGGAASFISYQAQLVLGLLYPKRHDMSTHTYEAGSWGKSEICYKGHVPVLILREETPFKNGWAHGYLLWKNIRDVFQAWETVPKEFGGIPDYGPILNKLQIPEEVLEELRGIVQGYNQRSGPDSITVEKLLLSHLIYERTHLSGKGAVGCTAVIDRNEQEGVMLAYNKDAFNIGVFAKNSLVIQRECVGKNTVEVSLPGFVGSMSGMNQSGLSLSLNVTQGKTLEAKGIPSVFLNRILLEKCKTVEEVRQELQKEDRIPLGPYHLSVVDSKTGEIFFMHQKYLFEEYKTHFVQDHFFSATIQDASPIAISNCRVQPSSSEKFSIVTGGNNKKRVGLVLGALASAKGKCERLFDAFVESLRHQEVNRNYTYQTMVFIPKSRTIALCFDECFSADGELHILETSNFSK